MSTDKKAKAKADSPANHDAATGRIPVRKTYKLFLGGAFPRSESGRSYPVHAADGRLLANAAQGSRKDVRDAVTKARGAFGGWSSATAYNRGQVVYRIAEVLEGCSGQFADLVADAEGIDHAAAREIVGAAADRLVWYAGWADKFAQVVGSANPVSGPYFNFSLPEPSGVVGLLAPPRSSLLGLVSVLAPAIVTGNTVVLLASTDRPLPAIALGEVLNSSDVPGGVVNIITGDQAEIGPWLAAHRDVDALDVTGAPTGLRADLARSAADSVTRVYVPASAGEPDWTAEPGTQRLRAFVETKTVWHPLGV